MCIESVKLSNHLIPSLPALSIPNIRVFSNKLALHIMWLKYWSFSFSISPSNEYSGLISFRIDWFDLLAVQGTFKSFLHHHSFKAWILWHPVFFMVQLSHMYTNTGQAIAFTIWNFVGKVMSLPFNMLSRFFIVILPRRKWLNFMAALAIHSDFGVQENKICHCFHFSPSIYHEVMGPDAMILIFWNLAFKPAFHSPLSPSSRGSLVPLRFLLLEWCHLHIWGYWKWSQIFTF